ncbi:Uncharacterised protein [BD1-7 clade bacterium]|nr:Uncharacterised protein [BD1-7 clade bacterium]
MEQFHRIAYDYYFSFYSFKEVYKDTRIFLWLTVILGAAFSVLFVFTLANGIFKLFDLSLIALWLLTFFVEFAFLGSFLWLIKRQVKSVRKRMSAIMGLSDNTKLRILRRRWLREVFKDGENSYLSIVRDYQELYEHEVATLTPFDSRLDDWLRFVFEPDAKSRVVSFLIALFSLMALLVVKASGNSQAIFEIVYALTNEITFWRGVSLILVPALLILIILVAVKIIVQTIWTMIVLSIHHNRGSYFRSNVIANYLVRDLVEFHQFSIHSRRQPQNV